MNLAQILNIQKGDIVSIVGSAGKTTMLYLLAQELSKQGGVLMSTTTKIYMPDELQYHFNLIGIKEIERSMIRADGIYLSGKGVNTENKVIGWSPGEMDKQAQLFDYALIEADGSRGKPLKGWNEYEPVICSLTTKTIGVISLEAIGSLVDSEIVHRIDVFTNITDAKKNEILKPEHLTKLVLHPQGLFKGALGERILFINKVENDQQIKLAKQWKHMLEQKNIGNINRIVAGSLKNKQYVDYQ